MDKVRRGLKIVASRKYEVDGNPGNTDRCWKPPFDVFFIYCLPIDTNLDIPWSLVSIANN